MNGRWLTPALVITLGLGAALLPACGGKPAPAPAKPAEKAAEAPASPVKTVEIAAPAPEAKTEDTATDDHHGHDHADDDHDHDHGDDDHDHDHGHHHEAPRGGTLIALGDHVGHFELVLDADHGILTAYALDGHAAEPVRMTIPALDLGIALPGDAAPRMLSLKAIANPLTGETIGDTSEFAVQDDALKGQANFTLTLPAIEFRGVPIEAITIEFPKGNE